MCVQQGPWRLRAAWAGSGMRWAEGGSHRWRRRLAAGSLGARPLSGLQGATDKAAWQANEREIT